MNDCHCDIDLLPLTPTISSFSETDDHQHSGPVIDVRELNARSLTPSEATNEPQSNFKESVFEEAAEQTPQQPPESPDVNEDTQPDLEPQPLRLDSVRELLQTATNILGDDLDASRPSEPELTRKPSLISPQATNGADPTIESLLKGTSNLSTDPMGELVVSDHRHSAPVSDATKNPDSPKRGRVPATTPLPLREIEDLTKPRSSVSLPNSPESTNRSSAATMSDTTFSAFPPSPSPEIAIATIESTPVKEKTLPKASLRQSEPLPDSERPQNLLIPPTAVSPAMEEAVVSISGEGRLAVRRVFDQFADSEVS